jgi:hypothetical protein
MYLKPSWFALQLHKHNKEYFFYTIMDFLDPKKKRAHRIRLLLGYALIAIAIALATLIMLLQVQGFGIDRKTGDVIQNGLLFVDAHPESAQIYINNERRGDTGARFTLPDGDYTVELQREGYRDWTRSFRLSGGSIIRLVYPFLFPEVLESRDVQLYAAAPPLATQSPDRRWLLVQNSDIFERFDLVDLASSNASTTIVNLPADLMTDEPDVPRKLELTEWSTNNRHVVFKHTYGKKSEFILVDKDQPQQSVNLNAHFARNIDELALRDKKHDQYYLLNRQNGELVSGLLSSKQVSLVAPRGVQAFRPHGNDLILVITTEGALEENVALKIYNKENQYKIRELPKDKRYLLDMARYDNKWYVVAGSSQARRVFIYQDPLADLTRSQARTPFPSSMLRLDGPIEYAGFSANARFISVQSGSNLNIFDAEESVQYRYDTELKLDKIQKISWMDGHRFAVVSDDALHVFDFDNANKQKLVKAHKQYLPFFDRDYEVLFTLSPSLAVEGRTSLLRTELIVD